MTLTTSKNKIIDEFKIMKYFEISARDYYLQVCSDPALTDDKFKAAFKNLADRQTRHINILQKIIELIDANL